MGFMLEISPSAYQNQGRPGVGELTCAGWSSQQGLLLISHNPPFARNTTGFSIAQKTALNFIPALRMPPYV